MKSAYRHRAGGAVVAIRWLVTVGVVTLALAASDSRAGDSSVGLSGSASYETFGYPDPDTRGRSWENFFELLLRGSGQASTTLTYHFEARTVADDADFTEDVYSHRNGGPHRSYFSLISAAIDYQPTAQLRLRVGRQVINWSVIDEIKPAALMMWSEQADIFRRTDHGVDALSLHYATDRAFVDLSVVPFAFTPSTLPEGRWDAVPAGVRLENDLPPVRASETQAGVRAGVRIGGLDASVIGYVGRSASAVFESDTTTAIDGQDPQPVVVASYPRLYAGGLTASYPVSEAVLLRAEAVYFASPDAGVQDFLQAVVGAEYSRNDWRLIVNYLQADKVVRDPQAVLAVGERRYLQEFLFGELRYDTGGRLRARVRGGYDFAGQFLTLQPELAYQLWGELEIALVAEVITSQRFSYFDVIRHEDRVGTRVRYYF